LPSTYGDADTEALYNVTILEPDKLRLLSVELEKVTFELPENEKPRLAFVLRRLIFNVLPDNARVEFLTRPVSPDTEPVTFDSVNESSERIESETRTLALLDALSSVTSELLPTDT